VQLHAPSSHTWLVCRGIPSPVQFICLLMPMPHAIRHHLSLLRARSKSRKKHTAQNRHIRARWKILLRTVLECGPNVFWEILRSLWPAHRCEFAEQRALVCRQAHLFFLLLITASLIFSGRSHANWTCGLVYRQGNCIFFDISNMLIICTDLLYAFHAHIIVRMT
jgi:hypothetical protein